MRKLQNVLMMLAMLCFAVPAFAQGGGNGTVDLKPIGVGIGIALAAGKVEPRPSILYRTEYSVETGGLATRRATITGTQSAATIGTWLRHRHG